MRVATMQSVTPPNKAHIMRMAIETITPDKAHQLLELSEMNRPLQSTYVRRLADAMKRGEWKVNGEAIKFSKKKKLLDGQHRLNACALSGVPFSTAVMYDVDEEVFDSLDQTKKRGAHDVFAMKGETHTTLLAGAARAVLAIQLAAKGGAYNSFFSVAQIERALSKYPLLRDFVHMQANKKGTQKFLTAQIPGVMAVVAEKHGKEKATTFLNHLIAGASLPADSPILLLRERLLDAKVPTKRLPSTVVAALTIQAWNAWINKRSLKILSYYRDRPFPTIE